MKEQKSKGIKGHKFSVTWEKATLKLDNGNTLTIPYNLITHLPVITSYKQTMKLAEGMALKGCMRSENNQNLSFWSKCLLRWHFKLGHLNFALIQ